MWCKSCGTKLGDPTQDLHDPKGEFLPDKLGAVENPDSHHIKAVYGSKGVRILCANTGDMTKLLENPPGEEPDQAPPSGNQPAKPSTPSGEVYDLEDDKQAEDILKEVIGNPAYGLSEDQVAEVQSWLRIYDGRIPPDMLEDVLSNLDGVANQKAALMRQKYEALINKWIVDQTKENEGPPIGSVASPPAPNAGGPQPSPQQGPQPQQGGQPQQSQVDFQEPGGRKTRQDKRVDRRQEVIDTMAEEMARNMASNAGQFYNDARDIFTTLLKRKAENDPEWFFEKADAFGFDIIDELSQPSQTKQQQGQKQERAEVDGEVDRALDDVIEDSRGQQPPPTTNNKSPESEVPEELRQMEEEMGPPEQDEETRTEEDEFDEIFEGEIE